MLTTTSWKKGICILLAFIVVFAGMCFPKLDAYFNFVYPETGSAACKILSPGTGAHQELLNAEELSVLDYVADITSEKPRKSNLKLHMKWYLLLFLLASSPKNLSYFWKMLRLLTESSADSRRVIIRYLHQKDGRKDRIRITCSN
ncbi:MAG: hypothetical protein KH828_12545 [Clostridiales bacterium]|nr:hypothetical protein [Clostridiales bacterium]